MLMMTHPEAYDRIAQVCPRSARIAYAYPCFIAYAHSLPACFTPSPLPAQPTPVVYLRASPSRPIPSRHGFIDQCASLLCRSACPAPLLCPAPLRRPAPSPIH
jgi:hypothetical protein